MQTYIDHIWLDTRGCGAIAPIWKKKYDWNIDVKRDRSKAIVGPSKQPKILWCEN